MRIRSIFVYIGLTFILAFIAISTLFWYYLKSQVAWHYNYLFNRHSVIEQVLRQNHNSLDVRKVLEHNGMYIVEDAKDIELISTMATKLRGKEFEHLYKQVVVRQPAVVTVQKRIRARIDLAEYDGKIYFILSTPMQKIVAEDVMQQPFNYIKFTIVYLFVIGMLFFSNLFIIYKLYPLRRMREKIKQFGQGDLEVSLDVKGQNEISDVANEFDNAVMRINELIKSRTLFLRNIMHELKTPITKGKVLVEMTPENAYKERLQNVFIRMTTMIDEMAQAEEITSRSSHMSLENYRLLDLVEESIDVAMADREYVKLNIEENPLLSVDFKLFVTAIKNMIDNGIKYSPKNSVRITLKKDCISFENCGDGLNQPLAYYTEPFTKSNSNKESFGLGLYIVQNIVEAHHFTFKYDYQNEQNIFIFEFKNSSKK